MPRLFRTQLASTNVDLHGDRFSVGALTGMVEQVHQKYIPVIWDHDIRFVPLGRVIDARVVPLPDGGFALETDSEYWTSEDRPDSVASDGRAMAIEVEEHDGFLVTFDRAFAADPHAMALIEEIARLGGEDEPKRVEKKALEPVATLVIGAGVFVVGSIAAGFLGQIGADGYTCLRRYLGRLFDGRDAILDFRFAVQTGQGLSEVHVVVDPPTVEAIDGVLEAEFADLDPLVKEVVDRQTDVAKLVVFWRDGRISMGYALRTDAFPIEVNWGAVPQLPSDANEGGTSDLQ